MSLAGKAVFNAQMGAGLKLGSYQNVGFMRLDAN